MPGPLPSAVYRDKFTTNMSVAWLQKAEGFVAGQVFPFLPVMNQSGTFPIFTKSDFQRDGMQPVGIGARYSRAGYDITTGSYNCLGWGLEHPIPDRVRMNADNPVNVDIAGAEFLAQQALIRLERLWAAEFFVTGKWTDETTPSDLWSDYNASTPLEDTEAGRVAFIKRNGVAPNIFVCGLEVDAKLRNHPNVINRYKVTNADSISAAMMARLLGVEKYLVGSAVYDTADKGATSSNSLILGKNAGYFYSPPTPSIMTPSSGYTFAWKGGTGNNFGISNDMYREAQTKSDILRSDFFVDSQLCHAGLAYFWLGAVA